MVSTDPTLREQIVAVERAMKRQERWLSSNPDSSDAPGVARGLRELTAARDTLKLVARLHLLEGGVQVADAIDALRRLHDSLPPSQKHSFDHPHEESAPA